MNTVIGCGMFPIVTGIFVFASTSIPALGPIRLLFCGTGILSSESVATGSWKNPPNLHLVPLLRMCGAIPSLSTHLFIVPCLIRHRDFFSFSLYSSGTFLEVRQKLMLRQRATTEAFKLTLLSDDRTETVHYRQCKWKIDTMHSP
jgi:hypothetical protein